MKYELAVRPVEGEPIIGRPSDAMKLLEEFRNLPREVMVVIHLTPDLVARYVQVAAVGNSQSCCFDTCDIFREALIRETKAIILCHNHPYEKRAVPTVEDIALTEGVFSVGKAARMPLLDHIVVGKNESYSFKDAGTVFQKGPLYVLNLAGHKLNKRSRSQTLKMISRVSTGFVIR